MQTKTIKQELRILVNQSPILADEYSPKYEAEDVDSYTWAPRSGPFKIMDYWFLLSAEKGRKNSVKWSSIGTNSDRIKGHEGLLDRHAHLRPSRDLALEKIGPSSSGPGIKLNQHGAPAQNNCSTTNALVHSLAYGRDSVGMCQVHRTGGDQQASKRRTFTIYDSAGHLNRSPE